MMKILSSRLCILCIFLVAIANIAAGAPATIMSPINRIVPEATWPDCSKYPNYPVYVSSRCGGVTMLIVTCATAKDPNNMFVGVQYCQPKEKCIEHWSGGGPTPKIPNASCADNPEKFSNTNRADSGTCSEKVKYGTTPFVATFGVTTYSTTGDPIQVTEIEARYGNNVDYINQSHNFSETIKDYKNEEIQFCFDAGSHQLVIAYAAVWDTGE